MRSRAPVPALTSCTSRRSLGDEKAARRVATSVPKSSADVAPTITTVKEIATLSGDGFAALVHRSSWRFSWP